MPKIDPEDIRMMLYNYALETREDIAITIHNLEVFIECLPPALVLGPAGETLMNAHRYLEMFHQMFSSVGEVDEKYPELMDKLAKDISEEKE